MGNAKAAVLPLPVSANPIRSRPCSASGIDSVWIGVGALYPKAVQASHRESMIPRSWKLRDTVGAGSVLSPSCCALSSTSSPLSVVSTNCSSVETLSVDFRSGVVSFSLRFFRAGIVIFSGCTGCSWSLANIEMCLRLGNKLAPPYSTVHVLLPPSAWGLERLFVY